MIGEFLSDPANLKATIQMASTAANAALGTNVSLPSEQIAQMLIVAKAALPAAAAVAGSAIAGIRQAVNKYKKNRNAGRKLKSTAGAEAQKPESKGSAVKDAVDDKPSIRPLAKKAVDPNISRLKRASAIKDEFSSQPDNIQPVREAKLRQQLNREQTRSRQEQKQSGLGTKMQTAAAGGRNLPDTGSEQDSGQGQQATTKQKFQQQTKRLRQEVRRQIKEKAKAAAKKKIKAAIKKKVVQRLLIWLAAAITPEVLVVILVILAAITVIIFIIVYVCDIPGISIVLGVVSWFDDELGGMCDGIGG